MNINLDELTYDDLDLFEEIIGFIPTDQTELEDISQSKLLLLLAMMSARKENPDITIAEVRRAKVGTYLVEEVSEVDPTDELEEGGAE